MFSSNKHYKQILIDADNYNALKKLGQTGDSFNSVIGKLINYFKEGGKN
jgi:predicted CopG family antitoxin